MVPDTSERLRSTREKLNKVVNNESQLRKSARATFDQFDADQNNMLDFDELRNVVNRLSKNLQIPNVDDETLRQVFNRYDAGDGAFSLEEFFEFYKHLLLAVRDKYYPNHVARVRRDFFVDWRTLKNGRDIHDLFVFVKKLGSGSFGEAWRVTEKVSYGTRVCKIINKERVRMPVEKIKEEVEIMKTLDHPNVIQVYEVYEDYNNIYIVMEECSGGELVQRINQASREGKTISETEVAHIAQQLLLGLSYCHTRKVAHKDLKPENVMYATARPDSRLKIIDFGVAEIFDRPEVCSSRCAGTIFYMAPEVLRAQFGLKCDIWSLGCIFYLLLTGRLPFLGRTKEEVRLKVLRDQPRWDEECAHLSPEGLRFLKWLLRKNPKERPTARQALDDPWVLKGKTPIPTENVLSPEISANLQVFMKQDTLKTAFLLEMAHRLPNAGQRVRKVIETFESLDSDGDGILSAEELRKGLRSAGWPDCSINRIWQKIDMDENDQVHFTEFLAACYTWRESELNIVWQIFNKFDADNNGRIRNSDFVECLKRYREGSERIGGCLIDEVEIQEIVNSIDKNGDGYIQWDEFLAYIRGDTRLQSKIGQ